MTPQHDFKNKWSPAIAQGGYTQIPNLLIIHTADLGITPTEFVFLACMLMYKRTRENPFPSLTTVSSYTGKSRNTMQAAARNLETKGLIERVSRGGNKTNEYNVTPLQEKLESYAQPIRKSIPIYRNTDSSSYRKIDTEEDALEKTKRRRRFNKSTKPTSLKEVLNNKTWS